MKGFDVTVLSDSREIVAIPVSTLHSTRSLAVAKMPCDCCVDQFWRNITGRRYFADIKGLSSTIYTVTYNWPAKLSNSVIKIQVKGVAPSPTSTSKKENGRRTYVV